MVAGVSHAGVALPRRSTRYPARCGAGLTPSPMQRQWRTAAAADDARPDGDRQTVGFKLPGLQAPQGSQVRVEVSARKPLRCADKAPQRTRSSCVACGGAGTKPCGQCVGTGINQEDLFGGRYVKGDTCWLCEARRAAVSLALDVLTSALSAWRAGRRADNVRRVRRHDRRVLAWLHVICKCGSSATQPLRKRCSVAAVGRLLTTFPASSHSLWCTPTAFSAIGGLSLPHDGSRLPRDDDLRSAPTLAGASARASISRNCACSLSYARWSTSTGGCALGGSPRRCDSMRASARASSCTSSATRRSYTSCARASRQAAARGATDEPHHVVAARSHAPAPAPTAGAPAPPPCWGSPRRSLGQRGSTCPRVCSALCDGFPAPLSLPRGGGKPPGSAQRDGASVPEQPEVRAAQRAPTEGQRG